MKNPRIRPEWSACLAWRSRRAPDFTDARPHRIRVRTGRLGLEAIAQEFSSSTSPDSNWRLTLARWASVHTRRSLIARVCPFRWQGDSIVEFIDVYEVYSA